MANPLSTDDLERIRAALSAGNKIGAIKHCREATGAGLADAKRAVEALEAGGTIDGRPLDTASNSEVEQIQAAVFAGRKILAIKLYRASTGLGLKESKEFIEALEDELRRTEPGKFTAPPAKGCGAVMLAMVVAATVLIGFALAR